MKKIILSLTLLLVGSISYSQSFSNVDVGKHKEYMMKTYKLDSKKADVYEQILSSLKQENEQLKNRRISSDRFKDEQKKIYKKYGEIISQAFSKGKYRPWSSCTQELERYHVLSETKFIPIEKMRSLYKVEHKSKKTRDQLWKGMSDELEKLKKIEELLAELNKHILEILGTDNGNWYLSYKMLIYGALDNMGKYGATYNEGYLIAQIESNYSRQRKQIWNDRPKNRHDKLQEIEANELKDIKQAVPAQIAEKWLSVNNSLLEYTLAKRYGLNKTQINQYKNAYNSYAIEEYKVINDQKGLPTSERADKLREANDIFCERVRPLFKTSSYKKWKGKRVYDFEQRVEQKTGK